MARTVIKKIVEFLYKYRYIFISIWGVIFIYFLLAGFSKHGESLTLDIVLGAIENRKVFLLLPILVWLYIIFGSPKTPFWQGFSPILLVIYYISNLFSLYFPSSYESPDVIGIVVFFVKYIALTLLIVYFQNWYRRVRAENKRIFDTTQSFSLEKWEIIIFSILILIFLILRFFNIDGLHPVIDEYTHLVKAKATLFPESFISGEIALDYRRANLVTNTVLQSFKLFGVGVLQARLPSVILSVLAIGGLYFYLRKIDKVLAIIATLNFTLSPWIMLQARIAREYIYFFPVYVLLNFYIFKRVNAILEKRYKWYYTMIDVPIALGIGYYGFIYDGMSTFKLAVLLYIAGFVYWLVRSVLNGKTFVYRLIKSIRNKKFLLGISIMIFLLLLLLGRIYNITISNDQINLIPKFRGEVFNYLIVNDMKSTFLLQPIVALLGLYYLVIRIVRKRAKAFEIFVAVTFFVLMYLFSFHFNRYVNARYLFIVAPALLIVESYGFIFILSILRKTFVGDFKKRLCFILILFNWFFVLFSIFVQGGGMYLYSGNYYNSMPEINEYLKDKVDGDVIVSTLHSANEWYFEKDMGVSEIYYYNYKDEDRKKLLKDQVLRNPKGYFIIDEYLNNLTKNGKFVLGEDIYLDGLRLNFIYTNGSNYVYEWGH